ncbi:putative F-box domain-containing protein [Rosa chinensis]|uniref:Putative F-box domain-containing protein n=1 Tax=Rosa chinensis TaxID=74649 RepID=A0A2P6QWI2_ROSCH|nr:putative F-box domain-containing protein [Rosa chinensis]
MDEIKWENLNKDCLENVFGRVGMKSLLLDVPFVCRSWHAATLDPSCWQSIDIPDIVTDRYSFDPLEMESWKFYPFLKRFVQEYRIDETNLSVTAFIKFVIDRSKGRPTFVRLPLCSEIAVEYVVDIGFMSL